jgi:hypothetical protein
MNGAQLTCVSQDVIGWCQIPNVNMFNVTPPAATYPDIQAGQGATAIVNNWGGGWADTTRNSIGVWGGGHADYYGNEVYSLNLAASPINFTRLNEPTRNPVTTCTNGAYQDGKPCSRHTYDYLAYSPSADLMVNFSGSEPPGGSFCREDIWEWAPSTLTWTARGSGNWDCNSIYVGAAYDPNSQLVFFADDHNIFTYNTTTHVMTNVGGAYQQRDDVNASGFSSIVIDPVDKLAFVIGGGDRASNGNLWKFDISNPASVPAPTNLFNATGCSAFTGPSAYGGPGVAWYPTQNKIVIWNGGNSVGIYDPIANSCTTSTFSGGPGAAQAHGTFGRFQYFPALGKFGLVNDENGSVWTLQLDSKANISFNFRCAAAGVLQCQGFDAPATFTTTANASTFTSGFLGNSPNTPTRDTTNFVSGASAAEWQWPANLSADNCCKDWWGMFGEGGANQTFGANSTFYFQFQWRGDSNYTSKQWMSDFATSYPKLAILENTRNGACGNGSLVIGDLKTNDNPDMYTNCGGFGLRTCDGQTWNGNNGCGANPEQFQQGYLAPAPFTGYECLYLNGVFTNGTHGLGCFSWNANTWYTMYWKVTIGTPGSANSTVEAWIAPYGLQLKKWLDVHNITITLDNFTPAGYNYIEMTSFATGHTGTNLAAKSWIDELIVSGQPICPTGGVSPDGLTNCPAGTPFP